MIYTCAKYRNKDSENLQQTIHLVCKITLKQTVKVLFQPWDNLFEHNFADLGHVFAHWVNSFIIFFMTRSTTLFSSTVFVISSLQHVL